MKTLFKYIIPFILLLVGLIIIGNNSNSLVEVGVGLLYISIIIRIEMSKWDD